MNETGDHKTRQARPDVAIYYERVTVLGKLLFLFVVHKVVCSVKVVEGAAAVEK